MVHLPNLLIVIVLVGAAVANGSLSCGAATLQQKPIAQSIVVSVDD